MKKIKYPELIGEMAKHGENQKALAKILGTTTASISRRLSGKTPWTIGEIDILCKHYSRNYHELFRTNEA